MPPGWPKPRLCILAKLRDRFCYLGRCVSDFFLPRRGLSARSGRFPQADLGPNALHRANVRPVGFQFTWQRFERFDGVRSTAESRIKRSLTVVDAQGYGTQKPFLVQYICPGFRNSSSECRVVRTQLDAESRSLRLCQQRSVASKRCSKRSLVPGGVSVSFNRPGSPRPRGDHCGSRCQGSRGVGSCIETGAALPEG
jgi:hypothetical protein